MEHSLLSANEQGPCKIYLKGSTFTFRFRPISNRPARGEIWLDDDLQCGPMKVYHLSSHMDQAGIYTTNITILEDTSKMKTCVCLLLFVGVVFSDPTEYFREEFDSGKVPFSICNFRFQECILFHEIVCNESLNMYDVACNSCLALNVSIQLLNNLWITAVFYLHVTILWSQMLWQEL